MDEDLIIMRHFDKKCKDFQSDTEGKTIKSLRKFGVEIEMIHEDTSAISALGESIPRSFGFEHDGSIETQSGETSIEIVTPILSGSSGENIVRDLFERINKLKFKINASCGLHIHLDGEGFVNKRKTNVRTLAEMQPIMLKKIRVNEDQLFVVKRKLFDELRRITEDDSEDIAQLLIDERMSTGRNTLYLGKIVGANVPEIRIRPSHIIIGKNDMMVDYYDYATFLDLDGKKEFTLDDLKPADDDYVCIVHEDDALRNTKRLLYIYSLFNDVFMAMLPKSRRSNAYCQSLATSFAPNQIEAIRSYTELEAAWYKSRDMMEMSRHKGNQYDDSRYYGVNLHSLFSKYGTIEIRSHSATLEPNKVLFWVALHQHILDAISHNNLTIDRMREGSFIYDLNEKTDFLIKVLGLRTSLRKYVLQRIEYFSKNNK